MNGLAPLQLLLAQLPPPPAPTPPPEAAADWLGQGVGIALVALLLLLMVLAARKLLRGKGPAQKPTEALPPALPSPEQRLRVELPPSEAEAARRREQEDAHRSAAQLADQRKLLAEQARTAADRVERVRLEDEARALRVREEDAKKEEYRAKKAADREEKERHQREQEEAIRQESEKQAQLRAEKEAAARALLAEEGKQIAAQAGQTLAQGLDRTRSQGFMSRLNSLFGAPKQVDESVLGELEEILFTADIGVKTASTLVQAARDKAKRNELGSADKLKNVIRTEVERILALPVPLSLEGGGPPHVVMVVGVNGAGKTTTIGKLAAQLTGQGKKVVLAAGDTFRAAATEQLDVWAERAKAELVRGAEGADPASVIFEAVKRARESGADVVIADTAGRLHTKAGLMDELRKVRRVIDKALPGAPHEVLLVLDATNGQNAIEQAKQFQEAVGVTAIALTKLDGTAKGGVVIGISDELKIPVTWVGVVEKIQDLRRFDSKDFVKALFD